MGSAATAREIGTPAIPKTIQTTLDAGGVEVLDRIADAWRELCQEAGADEPIYRPEFLRAFVSAFQPKARLVVFSATIDGRLRAVLPLISSWEYTTRLPARELRGITGEHAHRFDLITAAGPERENAVRGIWALLRRQPGWDIIRISKVPENGAARQLIKLAAADGWHVEEWRANDYPYVPLEGEGDEPWFHEIHSHFRREMGRKIRQAERQGALELVRHEKVNEKWLERFYQLERAGWKGQQGTAIACRADTRQFYDEIAREAAQFGYLAMYSLLLDGELFAAALGFDYCGRYYPLKICYDETRGNLRPGHILIAKILRDCKARGLTVMDFSGKSEEWKLKWTSHVQRSYSCWIFRDTLYGNLLYTMKCKLLPVLKRLVKRPQTAPPAPPGAPEQDGDAEDS